MFPIKDRMGSIQIQQNTVYMSFKTGVKQYVNEKSYNQNFNK